MSAPSFHLADSTIQRDPYERLFDAYEALAEIQHTRPLSSVELKRAIDDAQEMVRPIAIDGGTTLPHKPLADAANLLNSAVQNNADAYGRDAIERIASDLKEAHAAITAQHQEFITDNLKDALRELNVIKATLKFSAENGATHVSTILSSVQATERSIRATGQAQYHDARVHLTSALANARVTTGTIARAYRQAAPTAVAASAARITESIENARWATKFLEGSAQRIVITTPQMNDHKVQEAPANAKMHNLDKVQDLTARINTALGEAQDRLNVARTDLERSGLTGVAYYKADDQISVAAAALNTAGAHMKRASRELETTARQPAQPLTPNLSSPSPSPVRMSEPGIAAAFKQVGRQPGFEKVAQSLSAAYHSVEDAGKAIDRSHEHMKHDSAQRHQPSHTPDRVPRSVGRHEPNQGIAVEVSQSPHNDFK
jgi:hypothetical protein